jgi:hypothetical protein
MSTFLFHYVPVHHSTNYTSSGWSHHVFYFTAGRSRESHEKKIVSIQFHGEVTKITETL